MTVVTRASRPRQLGAGVQGAGPTVSQGNVFCKRQRAGRQGHRRGQATERRAVLSCPAMALPAGGPGQAQST